MVKPVIISALMLTVFLIGSRSLAERCAPFGNTPQALIQNEVPLCTGGKALGPWRDTDGTPRLVCIPRRTLFARSTILVPRNLS